MDLIKSIFMVGRPFFNEEAAFEKYNKMKKSNYKDEWHKYKEARKCIMCSTVFGVFKSLSLVHLFLYQ